MTLLNFIKTYAINKRGATKLIVRDLDEIQKNTFVAYVDENEYSFDVKLVLDTKKNVIETSCDCDQNVVCQHLVALANHLKENKKENSVIKAVRKKKISPIEQLIDQQDSTEIVLWLKTVLNKNKEWALAFKQQFVSKDVEFNKEEIIKVITDCFESVSGKRRKLETNEVKKIADSLEKSLNPYFEKIFTNQNEENYQWFWTILILINDFNLIYKHNSSRFNTLNDKFTNNYINKILLLNDQETWQTMINLIVSNIYTEKILYPELLFCEKLFDLCEDQPLRKDYIFKQIEKHLNEVYLISGFEFFKFRFDVEKLIFKIINDNKALGKHLKKFKPMKFENDYNISLINGLIQIEQYDLAKEYCITQIEGNFKEEYNLPYYMLLEKIYKLSNNIENLTQLYLNIGLFVLDFNIYLHLQQHANEFDFQKFKVKITSKLKVRARYGIADAFDYFYQLKKQTNNEKDLIDLFSDISNLDIVLKYFDIGLQLDKNKFLTNICSAPIYFYNNSEEKIISLVEKIVQEVSKDDIVQVFSNIKKYYYNDVFSELKAMTNIL